MRYQRQYTRPHEKWPVWKLAMELTRLTYHATREFSRAEMWGLQSQMRRAAVSVPSNIAEGAAKRTGRQHRKYLYDARASLSELETQIKICDDIAFISPEDVDQMYRLIDNLAPALQAFINTVERRLSK